MKAYIRSAGDADARYLTELDDFGDATRLLSFVKETGVYINGQTFGANDAWSTQIVVDDADAYFEIIVGDQ